LAERSAETYLQTGTSASWRRGGLAHDKFDRELDPATATVGYLTKKEFGGRPALVYERLADRG